MIKESLVFEAVVVKVDPPATGKSPGIFISPKDMPHTDLWEISAITPSIIPTTATGGGVQSLPKIGQRCLAVLVKSEAFILSYINEKGISPFGAIFQNPILEGAVRFSVDGLYESHLKLERGGVAQLYSHNEAKLGVDGRLKAVFIRGSRVHKEFKGGACYNYWDDDTDNTETVEVFSKNAEPLAFSDFKKHPESGRSSIIPPGLYNYSYGDKVIFRKGYIEGETVPYLYETRQAVNPLNYHDKTVITLTKVGHQKETGSVFEFKAKKNIQGDVGTYNYSIGKNPTGDFYHLRFSDNLNDGLPYGQPIWDPMGKEKGWNLKGVEFYELGIGLRNDSSALNETLEITPRVGEASKYQRKIFGESDALFKLKVSKGDNFFNLNVNTKELSLKTVFSGKTDLLVITPDKIKLKNDTGTEACLESNKFKVLAEKLYIGNSNAELISILSELLLALSQALTPGYMSPLNNAAKYLQLKSKVDTFK